MTSLESLKTLLIKEFEATHVKVGDFSHQHAGHEGAEHATKEAPSHLSILVVSSHFRGQNRLQRQRMILPFVKSFFEGGLHALTIKALTPEEFSSPTTL